jgi:5-methylcytosine-specific restriction endonuclease McrA
MARIHHRHRNRVLQVWGHVCGLCHARPDTLANLEIHHIVPQRDGGPDDDTNLIPLCTTCHTMVRQSIIIFDQKKLLENLKILLDKADK